MMENINPAGLALIKEFESCRLQSYQDQKGVWTIGWGHTANVIGGMTVTQDQADTWLEQDISGIISIIRPWLPSILNSNQFSACVSLSYNIGPGNFKNSTLLKFLCDGNIQAASAQFLVWIKVNGVPNDGLLRRRKAEQVLFNQ